MQSPADGTPPSIRQSMCRSYTTSRARWYAPCGEVAARHTREVLCEQRPTMPGIFRRFVPFARVTAAGPASDGMTSISLFGRTNSGAAGIEGCAERPLAILDCA